MEAFLTAILFIFVFTVGLVALGVYLMSKLVGGFTNLKSLYRLFSGKKTPNEKPQSAKMSDSNSSSRTYNNGQSSSVHSQADGKMFGQGEGVYVDFEEVKE